MASFKGYKRTIKLEFDYNEIKEGVPDVRKQMAVLNAEFKKSSTEAESNGKEIDKLGVKYDFLSNKMKIQEKEVENYRKKLDEATNAKGNNTKAIENNTVNLQIAEAKLAQTRAELEKVTQELDKQNLTLGKTSEEWMELSEKATDIGKNLTMKLTTPILAAAGASFKLGADLQDAMGKVKIVFKENTEEVERWADSSLKNFGLAKGTALEMAGFYGGLANSMGLTSSKSLEMSKSLTELTMDLATFSNQKADVVNTALTSVFTGETESLKKLGIVMTQANLQQFAYNNGIRKKIIDMSEAEKVEIRYRYVMEKTSEAHGNFKREQDGATAQMELFKQGVKELGENFSEYILPIFTPVITGINKMIQGFSNLSDGTKKFIVAIGGIVASVGPVLLVLGSVFKTISDISNGIGTIPKIIDGASKAGKAFSGLLGNTAFMGFAKWALVITGVVLAITALIVAINYLIGRGKEMNDFARNMSSTVADVGNVMGNAQNRSTSYGKIYVDGSHRDGIDYIPKDGYIAQLHEGERVLTKNENQRYSQGRGDTYILQVDMNEVDEVNKLVKVFNDFKQTKKAGISYG